VVQLWSLGHFTFMHALEFFVNGKQVCVAAPGDDGLIMSNVAMTGAVGKPGKYHVYLRVGGVRDDQHLEWIRRSLKLGDKVEIRVIDAPQSDPPVSIEPVTDAERERLRIASNDNVA
jgi:hypothetical protein